MEKKYKILHVFDDEKFFDDVSSFFETLNNVQNIYHYYTSNKNYRFKYIKQTEKIKIFSNYNEYISWFSNPDIDAIYFQGLCDRTHFKLAKYIGLKQKVIWWCFGAEIYDGLRLPPLVKLPLLKPQTLNYYKHFRYTTLEQLIKRGCFLFLSPYYQKQRKSFLKRVDYISPVIPIDFKLLKENVAYLKAKPFMMQCGPGITTDFPIVIKKVLGNVLVGNSLTYSNNHLDISEVIRFITLSNNRKFLFPISYGDDYGGKENFKKLMDLNEEQVEWMESFIPTNQYESIFDSVTHAIFGFMRQQGVGNIGYCLKKGIKVFLYKDSILYKQYTQWGYRIFSIEDDLNAENLHKCLSEEDAKINHQLLLEHFHHARSENVEKEIKLIFKD